LLFLDLKADFHSFILDIYIAPLQEIYSGANTLLGFLLHRFYGASSVVVTRPPNIVKTTGFSGSPVNLLSNLFRLDRMTDFRLFQYHVDFKLDVPNKAMRKAMIKE